MNKMMKAGILLLTTAIAAPALAQQVPAENGDVDVIMEGYMETLKRNGTIQHSMDTNDAILFLEGEKAKAQAIQTLIDLIGPNQKLVLPNGEEIDLSETMAGKEAKLDEVLQEQAILDQKIALEQKRVEASVMTDPAILDAMRVARERELIDTIANTIGPDFKLSLSDGSVLDLSETPAGKRKLLEDLKLEAELAKARATLASQSNEILRAQAEREKIEVSREMERRRLEEEAQRAREATQRQAGTSPEQGARTPPVNRVVVSQIYGENASLRARILINDAPVEVTAGDRLQGGAIVKRIEPTEVVLDVNGKDQSFYVY